MSTIFWKDTIFSYESLLKLCILPGITACVKSGRLVDEVSIVYLMERLPEI